MRLGRILMLIALLLVFIIGAIYVASNVLGGDRGSRSDTEALDENAQPVVAFSKPVSPGEKITLDKVILKDIPLSNLKDTMYTDTAQVNGLYARDNYLAGEIIQNDMTIVNPSDLINDMHSEHAALIAPGMVAVPIPINRFSGLAYGISIGDHVNIIATMSFVDLDTEFQTIMPNYTAGVLSPGQNVVITLNSEHTMVGPAAESGISGETKSDLITGNVFSNIVAQSATGEFVSPQGRGELDAVLNQPFYLVPSEPIQRPRIVSQTVLFNKLVLHVGNFPVYNEQGATVEPVTAEEAQAEANAQENQNADQAAKQDKTVANVPDIITLVVSPQEAVTLNYLVYSGAQLTVALRSPLDDTANPTDAVSIQYLLDSYRIPVPVKVPYGFEPATYKLAPPELNNDNP